MPEKPEEFYSHGAEKFAENQSLDNLPQEFIDFLDKFIEHIDNGKVLDAGCGPGRDTQYFIENGLDAVGIDLAEGMIEHAKQNKKGEYHLMDVKNLEFRDEEFDGIHCNTVLIFFPKNEMKEIITELKHVLKQDGIISIGLKTGDDDTFTRTKYGSEVKQYLLDKKEAEDLIKEVNLETVEKISSKTGENFEFLNLICTKKSLEKTPRE